MSVLKISFNIPYKSVAYLDLDGLQLKPQGDGSFLIDCDNRAHKLRIIISKSPHLSSFKALGLQLKFSRVLCGFAVNTSLCAWESDVKLAKDAVLNIEVQENCVNNFLKVPETHFNLHLQQCKGVLILNSSNKVTITRSQRNLIFILKLMYLTITCAFVEIIGFAFGAYCIRTWSVGNFASRGLPGEFYFFVVAVPLCIYAIIRFVLYFRRLIKLG